MTSASPRSILVLSGRYHIISNASLVNNCIILTNKFNGTLIKMLNGNHFLSILMDGLMEIPMDSRDTINVLIENGQVIKPENE